MNHSTPIIELSHVGMKWERNTALRDVNLTIRQGDFMAITGPNGGGKTTLLRIILKLLKPSTGTVTYFDREGRPTSTLKIGYLPQKNLIDSRFPVTVAEVVASGLEGEKISKAERRERVEETMKLVGVEGLSDRPIGNLSGGQLQRTLLGRAIINRPHVLVLDEPLSYVDRQMSQRIYTIVASIAPHTTILLVTHQMSEIDSLATRHLIVDKSIHECESTHHAVHYDCAP